MRCKRAFVFDRVSSRPSTGRLAAAPAETSSTPMSIDQSSTSNPTNRRPAAEFVGMGRGRGWWWRREEMIGRRMSDWLIEWLSDARRRRDGQGVADWRPTGSRAYSGIDQRGSTNDKHTNAGVASGEDESGASCQLALLHRCHRLVSAAAAAARRPQSETAAETTEPEITQWRHTVRCQVGSEQFEEFAASVNENRCSFSHQQVREIAGAVASRWRHVVVAKSIAEYLELSFNAPQKRIRPHTLGGRA